MDKLQLLKGISLISGTLIALFVRLLAYARKSVFDTPVKIGVLVLSSLMLHHWIIVSLMPL